ncbi:MAG TPA: hypothetical protein VFM18_18240 [Methanosarcina sp.]|nr:hypothetical protein [Methanosarcina sp.]
MNGFTVNEQFEGVWRVVWSQNDLRRESWIVSNVMPTALFVANNPVGFSTDNGSRATTMYIDPLGVTEIIPCKNIKCCVFGSEYEAYKFIEAMSEVTDAYDKAQMWKVLRDA